VRRRPSPPSKMCEPPRLSCYYHSFVDGVAARIANGLGEGHELLFGQSHQRIQLRVIEIG
jgi:hypothetical protein